MSRALSCPDDPTLQQFLLAEFDDDTTADLEEHLLYCNRCWESARRLQATNALVEALRVPPTIAAESEGAVVAEVIDRLGLGASPLQTTPESPPLLVLGDPVVWVCSHLSAPQGAGELARLGAYVLQKHLGSGGMGMVFQAQDPQLRRPVALKLMKPTLAVNHTCRERFLREARAAAAIEHDNIVTVYQVGEERGIPFLAMQMLQGESLDHRLLRPERLPLSEIARIGREIAQGLAAAHQRGLVHRDIKPSNIWLEAGGRVKLLDFGLAWTEENDRLTLSGTMVGTPGYMAPELARGESFDARCDLFSLGCVLFQLCRGELPFQGRDTMALLMALALDQPKPLRQTNPEVPPAFSDLVVQLLAKKPAERPASARHVIEVLAGIERDLSDRPNATASSGKARSSRRSTWLIGGVAATLLLGVLGLYAFQTLRRDPPAPVVEPTVANKDQVARQEEKPAPPPENIPEPPRPKKVEGIVNKANFDKVHVGMTEAEVIQLFGTPTNDISRHGEVILVWHEPSAIVSVYMNEGKVSFKHEVGLTKSSLREKQAGINKIGLGTTEVEVKILLGEPTRILQLGDVVAWVWEDSTKIVRLNMSDGTVSLKQELDRGSRSSDLSVKVNQANFDKIHNGMTEKEVVELLGEPTSIVPLGDAVVVLKWEDSTKVITIHMRDGMVRLKHKHDYRK